MHCCLTGGKKISNHVDDVQRSILITRKLSILCLNRSNLSEDRAKYDRLLSKTNVLGAFGLTRLFSVSNQENAHLFASSHLHR